MPFVVLIGTQGIDHYNLFSKNVTWEMMVMMVFKEITKVHRNQYIYRV